jgi:hypothetical protein
MPSISRTKGLPGIVVALLDIAIDEIAEGRAVRNRMKIRK